jgi:hypothetical protein
LAFSTIKSEIISFRISSKIFSKIKQYDVFLLKYYAPLDRSVEGF